MSYYIKSHFNASNKKKIRLFFLPHWQIVYSCFKHSPHLISLDFFEIKTCVILHPSGVGHNCRKPVSA